MCFILLMSYDQQRSCGGLFPRCKRFPPSWHRVWDLWAGARPRWGMKQKKGSWGRKPCWEKGNLQWAEAEWLEDISRYWRPGQLKRLQCCMIWRSGDSGLYSSAAEVPIPPSTRPPHPSELLQPSQDGINKSPNSRTITLTHSRH